MKQTAPVATALAAAYKTLFDGGFFYIFAGAPPSNAYDALDMVGTHCQLAKITLNNDGTTGLTWEAASNGAVTKPAAAVWEGTVDNDGYLAATVTQTPTFARFCQAGDTGRTAGTGEERLQFPVTGPNGNGEVILGADTTTDNGSNSIPINLARIVVPLG